MVSKTAWPITEYLVYLLSEIDACQEKEKTDRNKLKCQCFSFIL